MGGNVAGAALKQYDLGTLGAQAKAEHDPLIVPGKRQTGGSGTTCSSSRSSAAQLVPTRAYIIAGS
jgi:hypothetical protein